MSKRSVPVKNYTVTVRAEVTDTAEETYEISAVSYSEAVREAMGYFDSDYNIIELNTVEIEVDVV